MGVMDLKLTKKIESVRKMAPKPSVKKPKKPKAMKAMSPKSWC